MKMEKLSSTSRVLQKLLIPFFLQFLPSQGGGKTLPLGINGVLHRLLPEGRAFKQEKPEFSRKRIPLYLN